MKIKCAVCSKVESLNEDEKMEIGGIIDKRSLDAGMYIQLINIFRSKDICNVTNEQTTTHTWIYDPEAEDEINKMTEEYLMLKDAGKTLTDRRGELEEKIKKLQEELELSNKEIGEIPDKLKNNDENKTKNISDFKALTGSYSIEKWV